MDQRRILVTVTKELKGVKGFFKVERVRAKTKSHTRTGDLQSP